MLWPRSGFGDIVLGHVRKALQFSRFDLYRASYSAKPLIMRYGFVGLGHLGLHLAASLVRAGYSTILNDLDAKRAEPLLAAGAAWAHTLDEIGASVDAVITCLPSPGATESALDRLLP